MPKRIQRQRTKGWRLADHSTTAVIVDRTSKWGNPFKIGENFMWLGGTDLPYPVPTAREEGVYDHGVRVEKCRDAATAVRWFEAWIKDNQDVSDLEGRDLACFCPLDAPCHADVLLAMANQGAPDA